MLQITRNISIPLNEISITFVASQGAGGQNVNKLATAAHLRFDVRASTLPEEIKFKLLALSDQRITSEGIIVIKAQEKRTREQNRLAALDRLQMIISQVATPRKKRKPTRPSAASKERRLTGKSHRSQTKSLRGKIKDDPC